MPAIVMIPNHATKTASAIATRSTPSCMAEAEDRSSGSGLRGSTANDIEDVIVKQYTSICLPTRRVDDQPRVCPRVAAPSQN